MFRVYQSIFLRKLTRKNLRPHISDRVGDDPNLWITIFGFHASDAIMILNKFHQFGNILKSVVPLTYNNFEGCIRDKTRKMVQFPPMNPAHHPNYLHIKFENKKQVESALKIDGTAFAGYQFLGVKYRE
ncbi:hypothetical protein SNEBB_005124 [Seison nebaliae]|nr:hypothetical protein SNEBB_005124 [Seison nebaliae]